MQVRLVKKLGATLIVRGIMPRKHGMSRRMGIVPTLSREACCSLLFPYTPLGDSKVSPMTAPMFAGVIYQCCRNNVCSVAPIMCCIDDSVAHGANEAKAVA